METVIDTIMERYGMNRREAKGMIRDFLKGVYAGDIDPFEAEDIFMEQFGLEVDYLLDMIM